jgi:hypothetical protein
VCSSDLLYAERHVLTFVCRNSPLVNDVTTFWIGPSNDLELWDQSSTDSVYECNVAVAWSWQDVRIPIRGVVTKCVIAKFGMMDVSEVTLAINAEMIPATVPYGAPVRIPIRVTNKGPVWGESVSVYLLVDGNPLSIRRVVSGRPGGTLSDFTFLPAALNIAAGFHSFSVYAVDIQGTVSNVQTFNLTVIAPTRTPVPSPSLPPGAVIPIKAQCPSTRTAFNITGNDPGGQTIITTAEGYSARLHFTELEDVSTCTSQIFHGVHFSTVAQQLSPNALLLSFMLNNTYDAPQSIGLEVDSTVLFDGMTDASIRVLRPGLGFEIYSHRHILSFLLRGYPLVDNVTSFWFGNPNDRSRNYFSQTSLDGTFESDSAIAFAWQPIAIRSHQTVTRSVIVKFGRPDLNMLHLDLHWVPASMELSRPVILSLNPISADTLEHIKIMMMLDSDVSNLFEVAPWQPIAPRPSTSG